MGKQEIGGIMTPEETKRLNYLFQKRDSIGLEPREDDEFSVLYTKNKAPIVEPEVDLKNLDYGVARGIGEQPNILQKAIGGAKRALQSGAEEFTDVATLGLLPRTETGEQLRPKEEVAGGYANGEIATKLAETAGYIGGSLVVGEGFGKLISGGSKLVGKGIKKLPIVGKIIDQFPNLRDYTGLTKQVSREVKQIPSTLQKNFGNIMKSVQEANPDAAVDISKELEGLKSLAELDPEIGLALKNLKKYKDITDFFKTPILGKSIPLKTAQEVSNRIVKELPDKYISSKIKHGLDMAISKPFPKMSIARGEYAAGMGDYDLLHNLENIGNNITKIRSNLVNQNIQDAAKRRLTTELTNEISKYSDTYNMLKSKRLEVLGMKTESLAEKIQKDKLKPRPISDFLGKIKGAVKNIDIEKGGFQPIPKGK